MGKTITKTCDVTGITTSSKNFYSKQSHLKAVDNLREEQVLLKNK